jgi:galactokinase
VKMPEGYVFAVGVSGVVAEKTGEAKELYNRASLAVREILEMWNERTGRADATLAAAIATSEDAVEKIQEILQRPLQGRFDQFVGESGTIIPAAGDNLKRGDLEGFGDAVELSQTLGRIYLRNQVPETIALATLARECGAIAASAFGAGFGGSVWAMVKREGAEKFLEEWKNKYVEQFPQRTSIASFFTTVAGPAAMTMEL